MNAEVIHSLVEDFAVLEPTEVAAIEETTILPVAGSFGTDVRPMLLDVVPSGVSAESRASTSGTAASPASLSGTEIALANHISLPPATRLDQAVSIRGTGAEHIGDAEGAVDRIAIEILRKLERGRTLVVWAFDASGSLLAERKRLVKHIGEVYQHIAQLDRDRLAGGGGLLTAVVHFGKERSVIVEPTDDVAAITAGINRIPLDESGFESTFQAVIDISQRFGRYKQKQGTYRAMAVVVTDEVGDDEDKLDSAIGGARAVGMPVYVLGSPALFGRVEGYMDYTDPGTGQLLRNLPVRAGPETLAPEVAKLPFWYNGPQHEFLDAGFGPWALSRLASQTGGVYFIARLGAARLTFDPVGLREYAPDWDSGAEYLAKASKSPLRQAVLSAAQLTQQQLPGMPEMVFPAAENAGFKEAMDRNQVLVARVQFTVDEALAPIAAVRERRDHEPSRRWQAHYDLAHGRLLAVKLRCYEYNTACARMKKDAPKFTNTRNNAWRLVPDSEIHSGPKAVEAASEATELLERVTREHPGTPWSLLAERELQHPFGLKWVETYVPPPPPREPDAAEPKKKARNEPPAAPAPPPPKL